MGTDRMKWSGSALVLVLALVLAPRSIAAKQPNFLVVLTDDQDYLMESSNRNYMPYLHSLIGDKGTELRNFCVSMAWCCPSRVSLLTGLHTHNTNITSSSKPYGGGWKTMFSGMLEGNYLATWLTDLGYNTYFTGKFLNEFTLNQVSQSCPRGWRIFEGMVDGEPGMFNNWFTNSSYSNNCTGMQKYVNTYQTTIMRDKGLGYIDHALAEKKPFFIELAPVAPHDQGSTQNALPAPGDENIFPDARYPVSPNYNVSLPAELFLSVPSAVKLAFSQDKWINRIRSLKSVDDMLKALVDKLEAVGELNNTYIMYTSDNGFHLGQHAMSYLKFTPFEEDVRVPFFMRGPTIPVGVKSDYQATMVDVPATILALAGGKVPTALDGIPIPFDAIGKGLAGPIIQLPTSTSATSATSTQSRRLATTTSSTPPSPADPSSPNLLPPQPQPPAPAQPSNRSDSESDLYSSRYHSSYSSADVEQLQVDSASVMSAATDGQEEYEGEVESVDEVLAPVAGLRLSTRTAEMQAVGDPVIEMGANSSAHGLPFGAASDSETYIRDSIIIEGWLHLPGLALFNGKNYRVIRTCSPFLLGPATSTFMGGTCYKYLVWCVPRVVASMPIRATIRALHDLGADPYELVNLLPSTDDAVTQLVARLDAALTVLAYCQGKVCHNPWAVLHPDGTVPSLQQAMDAQYNDKYALFSKFDYRECALFYSIQNEIPDSTAAALVAAASAAAQWAEAK